MSLDFDFIIIGSGFGGSVSALRLAEKGYSVCVIEKGRRFNPEDYAHSNWDLRKYLWSPALKCFGIQNMRLFRHVLVLSGVGVGGGSLVYANTLMKPGDDFFRASSWAGLADWKRELEPHYETARKMLGVARNPRLTDADRILEDCAKELGRPETFKPTDVGVFFGEEGKEVPDPYFGGAGPRRAGCTFCGGCMVGCRHNAKNTLDKNYLYLAEKLGARVLAETQATDVRLFEAGDRTQGYEIEVRRSTSWKIWSRGILRARRVVLAGGVLGTLDLLLRCKYNTGSLPEISDRLGFGIRTNSESLIGVTERSDHSGRDHSTGIAIGSVFHPDSQTQVEPVRYPKGSSFMRLLAAPMADGEGWLRPFRVLWTILRNPKDTIRWLWNTRWSESTVILLVMQTVDSRMQVRLGRGLFTLFRRGMVSRMEAGSKRIPSFIPIANQVARLFAKKLNGIPQSSVNEVMLNIPITAHILGGCGIGASKESGVVDANHEVFGYPGLYVCDGSVIPANLGVNPSLTITAMAERAMSRIPAKGKA